MSRTFLRSRFFTITFSAFAIVLFIYLLLWFSSPWLFRYAIQDSLRALNLSLSEESHIRFNPFITELKIDNLSFKDDSGQVMHLAHSTLDLDFPSIRNLEIKIEGFHIKGLELLVDLSGEQPVISGFSMVSSADSPESEPPTKEEARSFINDIVLLAPQFTIEQSKVIIRKGELERIVEIHNLEISNANLAELNQTFDVDLNLSIDDAPFNLAVKAKVQEGAIDVQFKSSMDAFKIGVLAPEIKNLPVSIDGQLSFNLAGHAKINFPRIDLEIDNSNITLDTLSVSDEQIQLEQKQIALDIKSLRYHDEEAAAANVSIDIALALEKTALFDAKNRDLLVGFERFNTSVISLSVQPDTAEESIAVNFDGFTFDNIELSKVYDEKRPKDEKVPAILNISSLKVADIDYKQNQLKVSSVALGGISADIQIDKDKNVATLVSFGSETVEDTTVDASLAQEQKVNPVEKGDGNKATDNVIKEDAGTENTDKDKFKFHVASIDLVGENRIKFNDASVQPAHDRTVELETVFIKELTNEHNNPSPFELFARTNKYTTISLKGEVSPFTEEVNLTLKGAAKEFSLPTISSYIKEPLGFEINSGQLDAEFDVAVIDSVIDGKLNLLMRGADMSSSDDHSDSAKDKTMIPLNVALGMLKDGDGNIELKVPLEGRVDSPEFGVNGLIVLVAKKAAMSQAKSYLLNTFVPYASVVTVAMAAGEFALKLRFEDLPFDVAQVEIAEQQHEYIAQFIALLKDKPDQQVKVCGIATAADIDQVAGTEITDMALLAKAKQISTQRGHALKQYVIEKGEIQSGRLLVCAPQVDFKEGVVPRIELSI